MSQEETKTHLSAAEGLKRGPKAEDPISAENRPAPAPAQGGESGIAHAAGNPKFRKADPRPPRNKGRKGGHGQHHEDRGGHAHGGQGGHGGSHGGQSRDTGYFKSRGVEKTFEDRLGPGASFVAIPKFRAKRNFPFVTPAEALRKFSPYPELRPTPLAEGTLRIVPFGGLEQVGLNCIGFEYGNEILIVDMGLQFADQYQHGTHCSIPDLSYIKGKKVVGACITHGHIDHIGAVPYLVKQLGRNVPLFATPMAYELIAMKQAEINAPLTNMKHYERDKMVEISDNFSVMPFTVDHSIPDSVGLLIETPVGRFVHTGDWKFDRNPLPYRPSTNYELLESIGNRGVRALLSDSTNAHLKGSSISESEVIESIEDIFSEAHGRVITATFSSIIDRVMIIIAAAEKFNRKVVLLGRGMNNYMDIAFKLGYARPKPGTIISMEEANRLPDDQVTICCTGAQGERYAALMRIATGESKDTHLKTTDIVVFSSSVIPGNERSVQGLFDLILSQGPRIYQYKESEIHAGGHARQEDTKKMISLIRPEVYVPIYGYPHMLHGNARNAYEMNYPKEKVLIGRNGQIMEFTKDSFKLTDMYASHRLLTIDGYMVGLSKENELHERHQLMSSGVLVVSIAKKPGQFMIQIDSAGFPAMSNFPRLENRIREFIDSTLKHDLSKFPDANHFRKHVAKKTHDLVFDETGKEPIVLVMVH
jgi:ribonuclease J